MATHWVHDFQLGAFIGIWMVIVTAMIMFLVWMFEKW